MGRLLGTRGCRLAAYQVYEIGAGPDGGVAGLRSLRRRQVRRRTCIRPSRRCGNSVGADVLITARWWCPQVDSRVAPLTASPVSLDPELRAARQSSYQVAVEVDPVVMHGHWSA